MFRDAKDSVQWLHSLMRSGYMVFREGCMEEPAGPLAAALNKHSFFRGHVDKTEIQSSHLISVVNIRYVVLYLQMTERRGWDVFSLLQKVVAKQQRLCQPAGLPAWYAITVSDQ